MGKTSPAEIDICGGKVCKRLWHTYETYARGEGGIRQKGDGERDDGAWKMLIQ